MQQLLWKIHHWAGIYAGILIGILSLTGVLAVFIPEIDSFVLRYHYHARAAPVGTPQIGRSVDSLIGLYPAYRSLAIRLPDRDDPLAHVDLFVSEEGKGNFRYDYFIDPAGDRIIGYRDHQKSLANYLRQMHVRLYEGNWGRQLVGLGGIALVVVTVTGLLIYGNFMKKQTWPTLRKTVNTRIIMADWHKLLGIAALAFNLVIGLTGAWLGLQPWLVRWLDLQAPNRFEPAIIMEAGADRSLPVGWDEVLAAVNREFPDLRPRYLVPSTNGSATIAVRGNIDGLAYERDINTLILSKSTYEPVFRYDVRGKPFSHKLYFAQEALHFGDFGGLLLKLLYGILGLISGFLSISGFAVYLYRRKKRQRQASPARLIFVYSMIVVLFLVVIAVISLFIGYTQAATLAAYLINTLLVSLLAYAIIRAVATRFRKKPVTV